MFVKSIILFSFIALQVHAEDNTTATFLVEKPNPNSLTYILNTKDSYIAKLKDINIENGELKYKIFHKNAESEPVGFYTYQNNQLKNIGLVQKEAVDSTVLALTPEKSSSIDEPKEIIKQDNELDVAQFLVSIFLIDGDKIDVENTLLNNKITLQSPYRRAFNENILDERSLIFYIKFFVKIDPWLLDLNSFVFFLFVPYIVIASMIKRGIKAVDKSEENDSMIERILVAVVIMFLFYFTTLASNQVNRTLFQSFFTEFIHKTVELSTNFTTVFGTTMLSYQARGSGLLDKEELVRITENSFKNQAMLPYYKAWFETCKNAYDYEKIINQDEGFFFPKDMATNSIGTKWSERMTQKDTSVLIITSLEFCHNVEAKVKFLTEKQTLNSKLITDYQASLADKLNEQQLTLLQQMQMQNLYHYGFISSPLIASNNMFSENLGMFSRTQKSSNEVEIAITQTNKTDGFSQGIISDSVVGDVVEMLPYMLLPGADSLKRTINDTLGTVTSKFESLPLFGSFATATKQSVAYAAAIFLMHYLIQYLPIICLIVASFSVIVYYFISIIVYLNLSPFLVGFAFARGQADTLKAYFVKGVFLGLKPLLLVVSIVISVISLDLVKALNTLIIKQQFDNFFAITMTQETLSTAYAFSDNGLLFIKGAIALLISIIASLIVLYVVFNGASIIASIIGIDEKTSGDVQNSVGSQIEQRSSSFSRM